MKIFLGIIAIFLIVYNVYGIVAKIIELKTRRTAGVLQP